MSQRESHDELHNDIPPRKKQHINGQENCSNNRKGCEWKGNHEQLNEHLNHKPSIETFLMVVSIQNSTVHFGHSVTKGSCGRI